MFFLKMLISLAKSLVGFIIALLLAQAASRGPTGGITLSVAAAVVFPAVFLVWFQLIVTRSDFKKLWSNTIPDTEAGFEKRFFWQCSLPNALGPQFIVLYLVVASYIAALSSRQNGADVTNTYRAIILFLIFGAEILLLCPAADLLLNRWRIRRAKRRGV